MAYEDTCAFTIKQTLNDNETLHATCARCSGEFAVQPKELPCNVPFRSESSLEEARQMRIELIARIACDASELPVTERPDGLVQALSSIVLVTRLVGDANLDGQNGWGARSD